MNLNSMAKFIMKPRYLICQVVERMRKRLMKL